jgi:hypothetical protein
MAQPPAALLRELEDRIEALTGIGATAALGALNELGRAALRDAFESTPETLQAMSEAADDLTRTITDVTARAHLAASTFQQTALDGIGDLLPELEVLAEAAGQEAGTIAGNRALSTVPGLVSLQDGRPNLARLAAYAATVATAGVMSGMRRGTQDAGVLLGADQKTFMRVVRRKEPREHSDLEGVQRAAFEPWVLAGIPVDGPGDPLLPLSERLYCGHVNYYSRSEGEGIV